VVGYVNLSNVVRGRAERYLFIGGRWQDHVLTARTSAVDQPP